MMSDQVVGCLIAESDELDRQFVRGVISKIHGVRVFEAGTAEEALRTAEGEELGVIVLGIESPQGDAFDLCRAFRRIYYQRPLQIVLLSTTWESEHLSRAVDAGFDDVIRRPVEAVEMEIRVKSALAHFFTQTMIYGDREFYRNAVKQEEELSSRVLDQNMNLKRAYQNIEIINLELERNNRELQRIARYDILSGLMNRMSLFTMIDVEIERAVRTGSTLCGIMMDIDFFKNINDSCGHQCGDMVIRMIGDVLKEELRKYDHAGRYGGEEFFILLPNTSMPQARRFGERFRVALEEKQVECDGTIVPVTASLGIAQFRSGESREMWISRADRTMYMAKQNGRNRVEIETALTY
ncbi:MAG TPA: diguanylate cyclase [Spirochaetia bacterium]|nr:diguanylate cyclase [Spirochaetia bacterium]